FSEISDVYCVFHSSPTRRSSDLGVVLVGHGAQLAACTLDEIQFVADPHRAHAIAAVDRWVLGANVGRSDGLLDAAAHRELAAVRSEEHTSELQSRENLVCRLLLE